MALSKFVSQCRMSFLVLLLLSAVSANANPTLLVVGDSLSAGYQIPAGTDWVTLLSEKLANQYPDWTVANGAVSGATTAAGLSRMSQLLASTKPSVVVIELGGNDGLQGKPLKHIRNNLASLIQQSLDADAITVLIGIRIPPNYGPRYTEPFFTQYADLAAQYNTLYVPFMLEGVADQPSLMQGDGIHPVASAQPIILDHLWPTLRQAVDTHENRISR